MTRNTRQRQAIREALARAEHPLTPAEILAAAQQELPSLGIATVYRAINQLREGGELNPVELLGETPRYELAGKGHHHHFHCLHCDRVYDIVHCPMDFAAMIPQGFELTRHVVILYGSCADCRAAKRP